MKNLCLITFTILLSVSLYSCNDSKRKSWERIKDTPAVYPADSLSFNTVKSSVDGLIVFWINEPYRDYNFREFCAERYLVRLGFSDSSLLPGEVIAQPQKTTQPILQHLRKTGVTHFVCMKASRKELNICFYYGKNDEGSSVYTLTETLKTLVPGADSYRIEIENDPSWSYYNEQVKAVSKQ